MSIFGRGKRSAGEQQTASELRCSFCNKTDREVRKLIAGPTVFICDECVQVCNDILADDNRFETDRVATSAPPAGRQDASIASAIGCALCRLPLLVEDALPVEERGFLCLGCAEVIEAALAERRNFEP